GYFRRTRRVVELSEVRGQIGARFEGEGKAGQRIQRVQELRIGALFRLEPCAQRLRLRFVAHKVPSLPPRDIVRTFLYGGDDGQLRNAPGDGTRVGARARERARLRDDGDRGAGDP